MKNILKCVYLCFGLVMMSSVAVMGKIEVEVINESSYTLEVVEGDSQQKVHPNMMKGSGGYVFEDIESLDRLYVCIEDFGYSIGLPDLENKRVSLGKDGVQSVVYFPHLLVSLHRSRELPHFLDWVPEWLYPATNSGKYTLHVKDGDPLLHDEL